MNSQALREEFLKLFDHTSTLEEKADKMMSLVKDHVDYVIGEDELEFSKDGYSHGEYEEITYRNKQRAEQRNRGGPY